MPTNNPEIFNFITKALEIAKAPCQVINGELILAQCQVTAPPSFFRPARTETLNLQIVCQPKLLAKYPGAELVTRGSFRLQWLADGVKERGRVFRGTYPYDLDAAKIERQITALLETPLNFYFRQPCLYYQPHLLVNFKATFETDEKFDELHCLSINLTTGEISANLLADLRGQKPTLLPPKKNLEQKKIPYREGFQTLHNHLQWLLRNRDPQWIATAKQRWEQEVKYLESYYDEEQSLKQNGDLGFYRQLAATYRKFRPVIRIAIVNTAVLYLPVIIYHLAARGGAPPPPPLRFDPVRRKVSQTAVTESLKLLPQG
jgi:hypothetical protein